jgi:RimJ/RimL family protein N-acetyltransferase
MNTYLETERLSLRQLTEDDADRLWELDSDPAVTRYTHTQPADREVYRHRILSTYAELYNRYPGYGYWAAIEKATGDFIGWFHLRPAVDNPAEIDLGYRLRQAAWGKGYATEGARALVRKAFVELGAPCVTANALAANVASIRVMEKVGLRLARTYVFAGSGQLAVQYALRKEEFSGDPPASAAKTPSGFSPRSPEARG